MASTGGLLFASLTAGEEHTCGLTSSGAAYCWGFNVYGQLGRGDTLSASVPVLVAGGLTFISLTAGGGHTCGLESSGAAYCWGDNYSGQLGIGASDALAHTTPVAVVNP